MSAGPTTLDRDELRLSPACLEGLTVHHVNGGRWQATGDSRDRTELNVQLAGRDQFMVQHVQERRPTLRVLLPSPDDPEPRPSPQEASGASCTCRSLAGPLLWYRRPPTKPETMTQPAKRKDGDGGHTPLKSISNPSCVAQRFQRCFITVSNNSEGGDLHVKLHHKYQKHAAQIVYSYVPVQVDAGLLSLWYDPHQMQICG